MAPASFLPAVRPANPLQPATNPILALSEKFYSGYYASPSRYVRGFHSLLIPGQPRLPPLTPALSFSLSATSPPSSPSLHPRAFSRRFRAEPDANATSLLFPSLRFLTSSRGRDAPALGTPFFRADKLRGRISGLFATFRASPCSGNVVTTGADASERRLSRDHCGQ